jgi:hypothetical protein
MHFNKNVSRSLCVWSRYRARRRVLQHLQALLRIVLVYAEVEGPGAALMVSWLHMCDNT